MSRRRDFGQLTTQQNYHVPFTVRCSSYLHSRSDVLFRRSRPTVEHKRAWLVLRALSNLPLHVFLVRGGEATQQNASRREGSQGTSPEKMKQLTEYNRYVRNTRRAEKHPQILRRGVFTRDHQNIARSSAACVSDR